MELVTDLFINNEWRASISKQRFQTVNPANEQAIAMVAEAGVEDVELAVQVASCAFALQSTGAWSTLTAKERSRLLGRIADLMEEHREELATIEALDAGKSYRAAFEDDLPFCISIIRYYAGVIGQIEGKYLQFHHAYTAYTRHEAIGVVAAITPWNYPLMMFVSKVAPALAAGNVVIVKPAEETPLSALAMSKLFVKAGFPAGVVNVLTGGPATGEALVEHPGVQKIAFTGSTEVGKKIAANAAKSLKRVSLELGGKSPNIIFADVLNLEEAVSAACNSVFYHQGQTCCAGTRVLVEKNVYQNFLEQAKSKSSDYNQEKGTLISKKQLERVCNYISIGKEEGAKLLCGGKQLGSVGFGVEATIFYDVKNSMRIAQEEIFGPVMCVIPFEGEEEAIALANDTQYGLAAALWTSDSMKANRVMRALKSGTVWINCSDISDPSLPFGGVKMSGYGKDLGVDSLQSYTEVKSVVLKN
ncbi:MAG: aldehyde dehydrogenase family protein [Oligoflexia bacterium]|nr:aldehyde dehydrogenase family protein [Oligoflexia bacterium]